MNITRNRRIEQGMDAVLPEPNTTQTTAIPACSTPSEEQTTRKPLKHAFTSENAAEFTKKGLLVRAANRALRKALPEKPPIVGDPYVAQSLTRTRKLIDKLECELEQCSVPQASHYLVSSIAKLRDAEQKLANRPLPGSRRPGRESTTKRSGEVGPVE